MSEENKSRYRNVGVAWYVVHTYSGYENKVKASLEKMVINRGLQDLIQEIRIPMEQVTSVKDGKRKVRDQKVFPGYVVLRMVMTENTWYIVRNTRGVTGFVGSSNDPVPLTDEELEVMFAERAPVQVDFTVGQHLRVLSGPLENFEVVIEEVLPEQQKLRGVVSMFGRDTSVELGFDQVERL